MSGLARLSLILAVPLLASACSSGLGVIGEPPAQVPLIGTSWLLDTLGDPLAVQGPSITLTLEEDGSGSGTGGCNRYRAKFEIDGEKMVLAGPAMSTMMACDRAVMAREATYLAALEKVRTFAVTGNRLTLRGERGEELLGYTAVSDDLTGTAWTITAYNDGAAAVTSVLLDTEPTLEFGADRSVEGMTGCNTFHGTATMGKGKISLGPLTATEMACLEPEGVAKQEKDLLAALEAATSYRVEADTLTLLDGDQTMVQLVRRTTR